MTNSLLLLIVALGAYAPTNNCQLYSPAGALENTVPFVFCRSVTFCANATNAGIETTTNLAGPWKLIGNGGGVYRTTSTNAVTLSVPNTGATWMFRLRMLP